MQSGRRRTARRSAPALTTLTALNPKYLQLANAPAAGPQFGSPCREANAN
ncbi:hypothetical protein GLA29479_4394 [Lysobacter antibioticus]|nr:hypothetical protein GLA29479_4394 [Lysobacter antibioticus]